MHTLLNGDRRDHEEDYVITVNNAISYYVISVVDCIWRFEHPGTRAVFTSTICSFGALSAEKKAENECER